MGWIDRLTGGPEDTGERLSSAAGERIVRLMVHHVGAEVHAAAPRVSAKQPETGERFEGPLTALIATSSFAIIIIIMTGLTLASGDSSGGFRQLIQMCSDCRSPSQPYPYSSASSASATGR